MGCGRVPAPGTPPRDQGVRYRPYVDPDMTKAHTDCAQGWGDAHASAEPKASELLSSSLPKTRSVAHAHVTLARLLVWQSSPCSAWSCCSVSQQGQRISCAPGEATANVKQRSLGAAVSDMPRSTCSMLCGLHQGYLLAAVLLNGPQASPGLRVLAVCPKAGPLPLSSTCRQGIHQPGTSLVT